ncbi:PREDICTED: fibropellin-1-like [Branchiostoma belcheri]|uniref:Fibropellin-1-like n=1 Tax=Branchiostoma belcheri TaxID=7741 RepID=A0A6P4ZRI3_BRABE|nr:PREDICTED: fibropellin-1-like [Branchiostoma belcheri]
MRAFLLVLAVVVWAASAQLPQGHTSTYLTTMDNWKFYKVPATGPMTNTNVINTCEARGMRYPCHHAYSGYCMFIFNFGGGCISWYHTANGSISCTTFEALSRVLCPGENRCHFLDNTFVYNHGASDDDAYSYNVIQGSSYKYALCAVATCATFPRPCEHGTCTDVGVTSYTCSCEDGWTGHDCDQDIDECASSPCFLGGTCLDHVNGYSCVCPKDTTGKNCETVPFAGECYQFRATAATHSEAAQACQAKNGHLVYVKDEQQQSFLAEKIASSTGATSWLAIKTAPAVFLSNGSPFSGPLQWSTSEPAAPCDLCVLLDSSDSFLAKTAQCTEQHSYVCHDDLKPCGQNVCQNGGNCTSCFNNSAVFCDCPDGFDGKTCEINIDDCASGPCQNGGSCQDHVNSYSCLCPVGYQGDHCETDMDWCSQVQCPLGFICQDFTFYFQCVHPSVNAHRGVQYHCNSASCPDGMYCTQEGVAAFSCKPE